MVVKLNIKKSHPRKLCTPKVEGFKIKTKLDNSYAGYIRSKL